MAMGYTLADLAAVKDALASGALRVRIGDREVIYRSQKELNELARQIQAELSAPSTSDSPNLIKATFSKGSNT